MRIYKFWSKEQDRSGGGQPFLLKVWGYSNESLSDARTKAQKRLAEIKQSLLSDSDESRSYEDYFDRPVREELVQENPLGQSHSVLVRNRYGALVLCSEKLCFIDLDLPKWAGLLSKIFGDRGPLDKITARVHAYRDQNPTCSYRLYRTKRGMRLVLLDKAYDPKGAGTQSVMQNLGADPLYVKLCRAQECFRARLTPKPWRCGVKGLPPEHPASDPDKVTVRRQWIQKYDESSKSFATCHLVESFAEDRADRSLLSLCKDLHDKACQSAATHLRLA